MTWCRAVVFFFGTLAAVSRGLTAPRSERRRSVRQSVAVEERLDLRPPPPPQNDMPGHHPRWSATQQPRVELREDGLFVGGAPLFERYLESRYASVHDVGRVEDCAEGVGALIHLEMDVPSAKFDVALGLLPRKFERSLALARAKRWWMTPTFNGEVPLETQLLVAGLHKPPVAGRRIHPFGGGPLLHLPRRTKEPDDEAIYGVALPLVRGSFRCTLRGELSADGKRTVVVARCESGDRSVTCSRIDGALWIGGCVGDAGQIHGVVARGVEASAGAHVALRGKQIPRRRLVDGLGWCTWDAFYSTVDAAKVREGLDSIRRMGGTTVKRLVVDDGWMELDEPNDGATLSGSTLTGATCGDNAATRMYGVADKADEENNLAAAAAAAAAAALPPPEAGAVVVVITEETSAQEGGFVRRRLSLMGSSWEAGVARVLQLFAKAVGRFYARFVERADSKSWGSRLWRVLTKTVLKGPMIDFYEKQTDFTRKLASPPRPAKTKFGGLEGFRAFIGDAKALGVDVVTCWHAAAGYWGGYDAPDSETIRQRPTESLITVEPAMAWDPASMIGTTTPTTPTLVGRMYDDLYAMLASCGVGAVKADAQSGVGSLGHSTGGGPKSARVFVDAMERAAAEYFGRGPKGDEGLAVVNCMCHSTEQLYSYANSAVVRASDDFYPRDPGSWRYHLAACAANSVLLSAIALPDWDMFQSKHPAAWLHAASRCVSGGPVTLSDAPEDHDAAVLRAVALPDGATLVALAPARLAADSLFNDVSRDAASVLKIVAPNGAGGAVVGLFNVQQAWWCRDERRFVDAENENFFDKKLGRRLNLKHLARALKTPVRFADAAPAWNHELLFGDLEARRSATLDDTFVARSFRTGTVAVLDGADAAFHGAPLKPGDFDVVSLSRRRATSNGVHWAPLGLVDMLNGGGAVREAFSDGATGGGDSSSSSSSSSSSNNSNNCKATVVARGPGRFELYAQRPPSQVFLDGEPIQTDPWDPDRETVQLHLPAKQNDKSNSPNDAYSTLEFFF